MGLVLCKCYRRFIKRSNFERKITSIVNDLDLNTFQTKIIFKRYIREVSIYEKRANEFGITYNIFRTIVTVGSILLPAFLSIQNNEDYNYEIYWTTWGISIVITLCNGCIQLYSLDKNYITFSYVVEKLKTEGWKYFQCSGPYKNKTHKENFVLFCETVEKLKMKQVNKEIKFMSKQNGSANTNDIDANSISDNTQLLPIRASVNPLPPSPHPNTLAVQHSEHLQMFVEAPPSGEGKIKNNDNTTQTISSV